MFNWSILDVAIRLVLRDLMVRHENNLIPKRLPPLGAR